jgi:hypothetical protein
MLRNPSEASDRRTTRRWLSVTHTLGRSWVVTRFVGRLRLGCLAHNTHSEPYQEWNVLNRQKHLSHLGEREWWSRHSSRRPSRLWYVLGLYCLFRAYAYVGTLDLRNWTVAAQSTHSVTFTLVDKGFEGFPGTVNSSVTYTLEKGTSKIDSHICSNQQTTVRRQVEHHHACNSKPKDPNHALWPSLLVRSNPQTSERDIDFDSGTSKLMRRAKTSSATTLSLMRVMSSPATAS